MNVDDTLLMTYVDGELPPARMAEVERAIESSPELAMRVAALRASILPYRETETYARATMPPVPDSLRRFVDDLARSGVRPDADARSAVGTEAEAATKSARVIPFGSRRQKLWLAAAFIAGAFVCGAAIRTGMYFSEPPVAPWLEAAAGYQELYTRDTLADVADDATLDARLLDEVRHDDHLPIAIPDLRDAGLQFKRIQRLRFRGRPLVQIVYLPERGDPVALCVIDAKADQPMKSQRVYGMDVISWSKDKLAFALIGRNDAVDLAAVHRQLATNPGLTRVE